MNHATVRATWVRCLLGITGLIATESTAVGQWLRLRNELPLKRLNTPVVLKRAALARLLGAIPTNALPCLQDESGRWVPAQADDLDGDGRWDELAFLGDAPPRGELTVFIQFKKSAALPKFPAKTNVRFARNTPSGEPGADIVREGRGRGFTQSVSRPYYQLSGPGWENDKIAFRTFFDPSNGRDIFGKTTDSLVLDRVGINENWHQRQWWGMDILKLGTNSLGAGALALAKGDTVVRFEDADSTRFELLCEGPVRAVFRLTHEGWRAGEVVASGTEEIAIWAGKNYYSNTVRLTLSDTTWRLVPGFVNLLADSTYGQTYAGTGLSALATHARQADDGAYLGLGLLYPQASSQGTGRTPDRVASAKGSGLIQSNYVRLKPQRRTASAGEPQTFHFFAGWATAEPRFANATDFLNLMKTEATELSSPIVLGGWRPGQPPKQRQRRTNQAGN